MAELKVCTFPAGDGYNWQYRRFSPTASPRAEIIALHGIQSHGGWYLDSCTALADAGFGVSFLDRRGSGLNQFQRGDAPSFRRLLDDIAEFGRDLKQRCESPIVLMAISWGAKLAVALQKRHRRLCDALVLITPGFRPLVRSPLGQRLQILVNRFTRPCRLSPIPLNEPELFTDYPTRRQFIADDPLALRHATARLLFESRRLDVYLRWAARRVRVPTLVLLAEKDRIIDNRKTRRFLSRFRTDDVTVVEYPGVSHTLEFEPGGPAFVADVTKWIEHRFGPERLQRSGAALGPPG